MGWMVSKKLQILQIKISLKSTEYSFNYRKHGECLLWIYTRLHSHEDRSHSQCMCARNPPYESEDPVPKHLLTPKIQQEQKFVSVFVCLRRVWWVCGCVLEEVGPFVESLSHVRSRNRLKISTQGKSSIPISSKREYKYFVRQTSQKSVYILDLHLST